MDEAVITRKVAHQRLFERTRQLVGPRCRQISRADAEMLRPPQIMCEVADVTARFCFKKPHKMSNGLGIFGLSIQNSGGQHTVRGLYDGIVLTKEVTHLLVV